MLCQIQEFRDNNSIGNITDKTADDRHDKECQLGIAVLAADRLHRRHRNRHCTQAEPDVTNCHNRRIIVPPQEVKRKEVTEHNNQHNLHQ